MFVTPEFLAQMAVPRNFHYVGFETQSLMYKGRPIPATVAACHHEKCKWTANYAHRGGAIAGAWKHRQQHILDRRYQILHTNHKGRSTLIRRDQVRAADKLTHPEVDYMEAVKSLLQASGLDITEAPQWQLRTMKWYQVGLLAVQVQAIFAREIVDIRRKNTLAKVG